MVLVLKSDCDNRYVMQMVSYILGALPSSKLFDQRSGKNEPLLLLLQLLFYTKTSDDYQQRCGT